MIFEIERLAEKFGSNIAYTESGKQATFSELFAHARKILEKLHGKKLPVIIFGNKNFETMAAILACVLAKRAYVPVDISMPKERTDKIIAASGAGTIIDCTGEKIVFTELETKTSDCKNTAYIIFTSGSTGEPKGVPISYENLDNFIGWITHLEPMNKIEHPVVLNQAAFSFDLSTAAIYYSLFCGGTIVQFDFEGDFEKIFEIISKNKTDVFVVTPTFMRLCLLNKEFSKEKFPFVKCVYFCGETLQKSLVKAVFERFPDIRIINAYGPTEATSAVCAVEITKEMLEHEDILPVGKTSSAAVKIVIENGEIVLKGKSVFGGYLGGINGGHYTENKINCYRTGDMGFIRNGKIYCSGRKDGQIKYKGYRIELSDIEANISEISGVENCAVIAKRNPEGEVKLIKAFVSGNADENKIRRKLSKKLPEYMIPKTIKNFEKLPMNKNGKIDRKELENL